MPNKTLIKFTHNSVDTITLEMSSIIYWRIFNAIQDHNLESKKPCDDCLKLIFMLSDAFQASFKKGE